MWPQRKYSSGFYMMMVFLPALWNISDQEANSTGRLELHLIEIALINGIIQACHSFTFYSNESRRGLPEPLLKTILFPRYKECFSPLYLYNVSYQFPSSHLVDSWIWPRACQLNVFYYKGRNHKTALFMQGS